MSNDNITEWLLSLSMEELLDLEQKLVVEIRLQAKEKAREQKRLEQARLERERLEQQRLEQERFERDRLEQQRLEQERLEKLAQEKAAAAARPRSLPTNLYASIDQLAASQGLDISGLMSEIAKKAAQKPKPSPNTKSKPKTGSGNGRR